MFKNLPVSPKSLVLFSFVGHRGSLSLIARAKHGWKFMKEPTFWGEQTYPNKELAAKTALSLKQPWNWPKGQIKKADAYKSHKSNRAAPALDCVFWVADGAPTANWASDCFCRKMAVDESSLANFTSATVDDFFTNQLVFAGTGRPNTGYQLSAVPGVVIQRATQTIVVGQKLLLFGAAGHAQQGVGELGQSVRRALANGRAFILQNLYQIAHPGYVAVFEIAFIKLVQSSAILVFFRGHQSIGRGATAGFPQQQQTLLLGTGHRPQALAAAVVVGTAAARVAEHLDSP
uniref:Uncharacterized protein n=1 Tax=Romanomermis culicivorax TaxID=13658 RepID=A0A915IHJ4_ROMCU